MFNLTTIWHQHTYPNYESDFLEGQLGFQMLLLKQWFSPGADFAPQGYLVMSGDNLGCQNVGWGMLLISSEQRPGMQLNTLQCPGRPHNCILVFKETEISSDESLTNIASKWFSQVHREELPRTLLAYLLGLGKKSKLICFLSLSKIATSRWYGKVFPR